MTAAAHVSPPDASPRPAGEQDYVLSGRPLRPGTSLESTSRFGDDWWDLRPAQLQQQDKALSLNFANVPERYRADAPTYLPEDAGPGQHAAAPQRQVGQAVVNLQPLQGPGQDAQQEREEAVRHPQAAPVVEDRNVMCWPK